MNSRTTERFRQAFDGLPPDVRRQARSAFRLWQADPGHRSLQFKRVHPTQPIYSARIGLGWRALGVLESDTVVWFWIGSHADYDRLIDSF